MEKLNFAAVVQEVADHDLEKIKVTNAQIKEITCILLSILGGEFGRAPYEVVELLKKYKNKR